MGELFRLGSASLRVRLCAWYILCTFVCMGCYGAVLSLYLQHELRASREETMRRREIRFLNYMDGEVSLYPGRPLDLEIRHFTQASPENDLTEVLAADGHRLYPDQDLGLPLPTPGQRCERPCLSFVDRASHPTRVLTHHTRIGGQQVWLILAGSVDEHYAILNSVRAGYFLLLPLVLLGSVAGGFELSRRALQPVGRMTEAARRLSVTGLDGRLPVPQTGDELQSLAEAWNDLLIRLESEVHRSTQFTMDASHDLRTAVTIILSNTQLALRRDREPAAYRNVLNTVQQETLHILSLLEELLLAAGGGGRPAVTSQEPVELGMLVTEVYQASCAAATIKELKLELSHIEQSPLIGDRALLRRMVGALIENAVKYTPAGGCVEVSLTRSHAGMLLLVQDTGVGIDPAFHDRIFDRLYRVDATRTCGDTSGNGLGLTIAKWIADTHGFKIAVDSHLGAGSKFSILIPAPDAAALSEDGLSKFACRLEA